MKLYYKNKAAEYSKYDNLMNCLLENTGVSEFLETSDLVLFGGDDPIAEELYGEKQTTIHRGPTQDLRDVNLFMRALRNNIPMLGISRGASFLTAMAGGKIIKKVSGHYFYENNGHVVMYGSKVFNLESSHTTMMYPYNLPNNEYKVLVSPVENLSNIYVKGEYQTWPMINKQEPEIVYYPDINAIAIQAKIYTQLEHKKTMGIISEILNQYLWQTTCPTLEMNINQ